MHKVHKWCQAPIMKKRPPPPVTQNATGTVPSASPGLSLQRFSVQLQFSDFHCILYMLHNYVIHSKAAQR